MCHMGGHLPATRVSQLLGLVNVHVDGSSNGAHPGGATVSITWQLPNGSTLTKSATTNSSGVATFTARSGLGTYTLTV